MSSKELIIKALNREKTERVPVALLSGGAWTFNRKGLTLEEALNIGAGQAAEIIAETNELAKSDIVWPSSGYHNLAIRAIGGEIKFRSKGTPDVQSALLKDINDIETINLDHLTEDKDINMLVETAAIVSENIGGHTLIGASQWGPFTLAGHIYGVEKLMRSIYRDKEAVKAVLEFTSELCYRYLALFIDAGVEIVSVADPTSSGDLISRKQFEEFSLPYLKKVVQKVKEKGALSSIHICGNITDRLDLIPETGVNNLSIDYKVEIKTAREKIGDQITFSGNMNPVAIMQNASPEEVAEVCRDCIDQAGWDAGYILMPGCDLPPAVPLENIVSMVDTAWNYQQSGRPDQFCL